MSESGGQYKTRTCDLLHVTEMRYQLRQLPSAFTVYQKLPQLTPAAAINFNLAFIYAKARLGIQLVDHGFSKEKTRKKGSEKET